MEEMTTQWEAESSSAGEYAKENEKVNATTVGISFDKSGKVNLGKGGTDNQRAFIGSLANEISGRMGAAGASQDQIRAAIEQALNKKGDSLHLREQIGKKSALQFATDNSGKSTTSVVSSGERGDRGSRDQGPETTLHMLLQKLQYAYVQRISGAEVTNFQLQGAGNVLGMAEGTSKHNLHEALNAHANEMEVIYNGLKGGYGQELIDAYSRDNPTTMMAFTPYQAEDGSTRSPQKFERLDPNPVGNPITNPGSNAAQPEYEANQRRRNETPPMSVTGPGMTGEPGIEATGIGPAKRGYENYKRGDPPLENSVPALGNDPAKSVKPVRGDNKRVSNFPKAMDIFKTPKDQDQANALAQTIAILQSQSQLNA
jgi:hypothetical protein